MADEVLIEKPEDGIALLTFNRPQAMNALNRAMTVRLREALRSLEADTSVNLIIVTGAGGKAFCVGVDLKERREWSDEEAQAFRMGELFPMYREFEEKQKPSIALVDGHCLGGGFELAMACDLIVATTNSKFALPEVKWGLIPAAGGCRKLPKLIGAARAKEAILTGNGFSAEEALRLGIINRVVPKEKALDEALSLARQVLGNAQVAVRGAKRSIDRSLDADRTISFDLEVANSCYADKERKEGLAKFTSRKS
jgi:enoyl-CoA hydratase/carnithine racemase